MYFTEVSIILSLAIGMADEAAKAAVRVATGEVYNIPVAVHSTDKMELVDQVRETYLQTVGSRAWEAKFREVMPNLGYVREIEQVLEQFCQKLPKATKAYAQHSHHIEGLTSVQEHVRWIALAYLTEAAAEKMPEYQEILPPE